MPVGSVQEVDDALGDRLCAMGNASLYETKVTAPGKETKKKSSQSAGRVRPSRRKIAKKSKKTATK